MTAHSYRLALTVLLVIAIVACVNAQPDSDGYNPLGFEYLGEGIPEMTEALFNNEVGILTTDPMRHPTAHPRSHQKPSDQYARDNAALSRASQQPSTPTLPRSYTAGSQAQTYAAVVRGGEAPRKHYGPPQPQSPSIEQRFTVQQQFHHGALPILSQPSQKPLNTQTSWGSNPTSRSKTYAEVLRSPPPVQDLDSWLKTQDWLNADVDMVDAHEPVPSQLLPDDITSNVNFNPGMTDSTNGVRDWASQPRVAGDRLAPRLDTNRLLPQTPSTHRSPISAPSPSSSRMGSRRTKEQLILGNYAHRCPICQAGFDIPADLKHHARSHTPYSQRPHACALCDKRFLYAKDLKRHWAKHDDNRIFCPHSSCKFSWKGFGRRDHLERHLTSQHAVDSVQQSSQPPSSRTL